MRSIGVDMHAIRQGGTDGCAQRKHNQTFRQIRQQRQQRRRRVCAQAKEWRFGGEQVQVGGADSGGQWGIQD